MARMNEEAKKIIEKLGGVSALARLFEIRVQSVIGWKKRGIPHSRVMYLRLCYVCELDGSDLDAAMSQRRGA